MGMDFSNPILMSMMDSKESNDYWRMFMMMQALGNGNGNGGGGEGSGAVGSQRMQMLMMAPMGKRFIYNLTKKIGQMSQERRNRVMAALIAAELAKRQSDEFGQILENGSMSILMQLVGMPSLSTGALGMEAMMSRSLQGNDDSSSTPSRKRNGEVGGEVLKRRIMKEPAKEAQDMEMIGVELVGSEPLDNGEGKKKKGNNTMGFSFT